ncbi:membrane protease YdiL (CAAX protease family) [Mucilaginibacter gracilis]|uniref:Membrane protease YdiL (CAAX protease family) n=1 Tax=Mucilaginibacter gracilis TaxID=423350 RepID=A0A495J2P2_9SPHI|nr:CPBP family intramembrane glutamic endopeptidase [Mucilaginibacter gracilis]RKR83240.1 membrane protease YdiL (CAAX protease family) [Mucilaginibacter gracilis]
MNNTALEQDSVVQKSCINCNEIIAVESRFCKHCGSSQTTTDENTATGGWTNIKHAALLFGVDVVICCVASFIDVFKTLLWSVVFDVLLAVVALAFFCDNWKKNMVILRWPQFSVLKLLGYGGAAVLASLAVSFCVHWLNQALFSKEFYYYGFYAHQKYAAALMIFFVAVMPALFEELAYRGYLLQNLLGVADKNQAIFITSFLFAILHLSLLSLFWLIPFALLLGYVRVKEKTLWYGVFMHFCFNLTVCIVELWRYS